MRRRDDGETSTSDGKRTRDDRRDAADDDSSDSHREPLAETFGRIVRVGRASLAHHPRVRALRQLVSGTSADDLPRLAELVMLGVTYWSKDDECNAEKYDDARRAWERDWGSRCWMTYRRGFEALGRTKWRTDAGWGCTLRSAQMMVANALSIHTRGRHWRRQVKAKEDDESVDREGAGDELDSSDESPTSFLGGVVRRLRIPEIQRTNAGCDAQEDVLSMFIDDASAPFSIHSVCETTTAWGAPPGRWFEPSVMCRAFSALIEANGDLRNQIAVHVVGGQNEDDSAGGVPTIDDGELRAKSADVGKALLLFVPLVLGVGRNINTRYISQLRSIIAFKQSIGVIGGRPNASLYLVGHSDDVFFYLDPHTVQPANSFAEAVDFDSYYCSTPLQMRGELLDPTLALGFYCRDGDDLDSLFASVKALAEANATAPVLEVRSATEAKAFDARASSPSTARGRALKDDEFHDWEFL